MTLSIFTNQNTAHLIELFLWMLGAFLIGWIFWRMWYKNKCQNEISAWRTKYDSLKNKKDDTTMKVKKVAAPGIANIPSNNFVDGVAKIEEPVVKATPPKVETPVKVAPVKVDAIKDDLTKVEGIGPKIKGLLNDDDIWSFKQLSETAVSRIEKILTDAGPRYKMHSPKTWPEQSKMAHEGKWDELKVWQSNHKGGREN